MKPKTRKIISKNSSRAVSPKEDHITESVIKFGKLPIQDKKKDSSIIFE